MNLQREYEGDSKKLLACEVPEAGAIAPFTQKRGWDNEEAGHEVQDDDRAQTDHFWMVCRA